MNETGSWCSAKPKEVMICVSWGQSVTFFPACLSTMAPSLSLPGLAMVRHLTSCDSYSAVGSSCTWRQETTRLWGRFQHWHVIAALWETDLVFLQWLIWIQVRFNSELSQQTSAAWSIMVKTCNSAVSQDACLLHQWAGVFIEISI